MAKLTLAPSSNVAGAEYDEATRTLTIEFHGSGSYTYSAVDAQTARDFETAPSPGRFHHTRLKGRFRIRWRDGRSG